MAIFHHKTVKGTSDMQCLNASYLGLFAALMQIQLLIHTITAAEQITGI